MVVSSRNNIKVRDARRLKLAKFRQRTGLVLVEGVKHIRDAYSAGGRLVRLFVSEQLAGNPAVAEFIRTVESGTDVVICTDAVVASISSVETCQGLVAVFKIPFSDAETVISRMTTGGVGFVLDRIQDPTNLGTMLRTASACGASGVIVSEGTVDPFNDKVVRSSASALFSVDIVRVTTLPALVDRLKSSGVKVVALNADSTQCYFDVDLTGPLALVVGNEGAGISQEVLQLADYVVSIPMPGQVESLNAAVAMSIVAYEAVRQRMRVNRLVCGSYTCYNGEEAPGTTGER